jgi:CDGSH-type Zn-finger protein
MEEKKDKKPRATVEVIEFGPLKISGNFILKDLKRGKEESPGEIWLCRCGKSNDKPYCDGSHSK